MTETQGNCVSIGKSDRIPTLDGWRAVAVSLVIAAHSVPMMINNGRQIARAFAVIFSHAAYGVDVFFCLSGFLICGQLLSEKEHTGTISLSNFYVRRVFRILPPIFVFLTVVVILSSGGILPRLATSDLLGTLFFYRNYVDGDWYTGHFWSLAVEEQFYAVIPLLLLLSNRRWAVRGALILIALCIVIRWIEYSYGLFADRNLQFRTENRFDGLLWGGLLAIAMQSQEVRAWLKAHLTSRVFFVMVIGVTILLVAFRSQPGRRMVIAAFLPLLIAHTVLHADGFIGRILEMSPLKWLGRLSYSLYVWQQLFLVPTDRPWGAIQSFPLNLICTLICAVASYYLLEKPMMRMGRRFGGTVAGSMEFRRA